MGEFTAAVAEWAQEEEDALLGIFRQSTMDLIELIKTPKASGGNMPIDTSFLQNSLQGSKADVPSLDPSHDASQPPMVANAAVIEALIAGAELGDVLHFGFTAIYALRQNYGFTGYDSLGRYYNQPGNFFVEHALEQWQEIVDRNSAIMSATLAFGE